MISNLLRAVQGDTVERVPARVQDDISRQQDRSEQDDAGDNQMAADRSIEVAPITPVNSSDLASPTEAAAFLDNACEKIVLCCLSPQ